jgi:hypothetical protein
MVAADDTDPWCLSCRLTRVIPDLSQPGHREQLGRIEQAKRRLLYTLYQLGLPVQGRAADAEHGLEFQFRADPPAGGDKVLTGHNSGVITLNVVEADDAERERRRSELHEPYRTLLGHLRHEIGHYYWDILVQDSARLDACRSLFGDEREDYSTALQQHYAHGPPADWQQRFVSAYASSHPWEDWAETWAHYLHMMDTLDTAAASGLMPQRGDRGFLDEGFDSLASDWLALTCVLNNLNRSMGMPDAYPFVLSSPALAKLEFVHAICNGVRPA